MAVNAIDKLQFLSFIDKYDLLALRDKAKDWAKKSMFEWLMKLPHV